MSRPLRVSSIARDIFTRFRDLRASDIHLVAGLPVHYRVNGILQPDGQALTPGAVRAFLAQITDGDILATLLGREEIDLSLKFDLDDGPLRFRVNIALSEKIPYVVIRRLLEIKNTPSRLGIPDEFTALCREHSHGVIFVTGTTGSGKSTTLASVLAHLLKQNPWRVITLEDPIEYAIPSGMGVVTQREIGRDTKSFASALRAAMRQDPDVILVGEVRDAETAEALLAAAETGHLVFATLHVGAATIVPERIAGMFRDTAEGAGAKKRLYNILAGVLTQVLVPSKNGRSLGWELLTVGRKERELLITEDFQGLREIMARNRHRLADCLVRMAARGLCDEQTVRPLVNYHYEWDEQYLEEQRRLSPSVPEAPPEKSGSAPEGEATPSPAAADHVEDIVLGFL